MQKRKVIKELGAQHSSLPIESNLITIKKPNSSIPENSPNPAKNSNDNFIASFNGKNNIADNNPYDNNNDNEVDAAFPEKGTKKVEYTSNILKYTMNDTFQVADWITILNCICGFASILSCLYVLTLLPPNVFIEYHLIIENDLLYTGALRAFVLPFFGLLFDILDGRVARLLSGNGKGSLLGKELDSLSDVISFGVAPACIAFICGLQSNLDILLLVLFVCCGLTRLARFNVLAAKSDGPLDHFQGIPIPSSLTLILYLSTCIFSPIQTVPSHLWAIETGLGIVHLGAIFFGLWGYLMISKSLIIPKF